MRQGTTRRPQGIRQQGAGQQLSLKASHAQSLAQQAWATHIKQQETWVRGGLHMQMRSLQVLHLKHHA